MIMSPLVTWRDPETAPFPKSHLKRENSVVVSMALGLMQVNESCHLLGPCRGDSWVSEGGEQPLRLGMSGHLVCEAQRQVKTQDLLLKC